MEAYTWTEELRPIYDKAVALYQDGKRGAETYFNEAEVAELASIGLKPINIYDYAEDFAKYSEPGWDSFLLVAAARRDYFLYEQKGVLSTKETSAEELPPKPEALDGIPWLPRIIMKARCFLEGGLCYDIMYGCGGDRKFLKEHSIHLADFLREVWSARGNDQKILEFVKNAKKA